MNNHFIILLIFLASTSCKTKDKDPIGNFETTYYIEHKKLQIDPVKLVSFGRLLLFEDYKLLIKENFQGEVLLSKIYYEKDSVTPLVKKGNGPHELLMPQIMQKESDSLLYVLDIAQNKIILQSINNKIISELKLKNTLLNAISLDNQYIASGFNEKIESEDNTRYTLLDSTGIQIGSFGEFPNDKNTASNTAKLLAYQGHIIRNPIKKRIAFASCYGAIFDIYEIKEHNIMPITNSHNVFASYTDDSQSNKTGIIYKNDNLFGYMDIYATNRFIFTLYSGKFLENSTNSDMEKAMCSRHILVYDWDGKPIYRIDTDIDLSNICISDDCQQLIGLFYENEEYGLCSFDLSKIPLNKTEQE